MLIDIKKITSDLVDDYINSEWLNHGRALIPPQAREELLCGARIYFYLPESHIFTNAYQDEEMCTALCNPSIFSASGNMENAYSDGPIHITIKSQEDMWLLGVEIKDDN